MSGVHALPVLSRLTFNFFFSFLSAKFSNEPFMLTQRLMTIEPRDLVASCSVMIECFLLKLVKTRPLRPIMDLIASITGWCNLSLNSAEYTGPNFLP